MTDSQTETTQTRPDKAAFVIALVLAGLALLIAWDAAHLSARVATYSRVGAAAFPYAISAFLFIAAVFTAIAAARGTFPQREPLELGAVGWISAGLILQIVLLPFTGFSIATGILFALTARGFGGKPLWLSIPAGIVLSFVLYIIFNKGLELSLPQGFLERLI